MAAESQKKTILEARHSIWAVWKQFLLMWGIGSCLKVNLELALQQCFTRYQDVNKEGTRIRLCSRLLHKP